MFRVEKHEIDIFVYNQGHCQKYKTEKPDFILLDILLPDKNGIYFLQKRLDDPQIKSIPVVAFSNFDDAATREETFRLGANDYLIKTNYTPREIIEKVKKYIGQDDNKQQV